MNTRPRDDIIETAQRLRAESDLVGWEVRNALTDADFWTSYSPRDVPTVDDVGYKIHVSASLKSAGDVLAKTIPILAKLRIPFKHASSRQNLLLLSNGKAGLTQIGKFLTAYPPDTEMARYVARSLHEATATLQGPRIASEQPFASGSLVHFRFGSFAEHWLQLPTGRIVPARRAADGLEPDWRVAGGNESADLGIDRATGEEQGSAVRHRYVRMQKLHSSPKGSTWLGYDREAPEGTLAVIKEAYAYIMEAADGLDARGRLRNEADRLSQLQHTGLTPVFVDQWESEGSSFLVYHLIEGPTFASVLNRLAADGLRPPDRLLLDWMAALASAVGKIHRLGYVLGDIKPSNLIFADGSFRFIDLELAGPPTVDPTGSMGTRGYCSPEQADPKQGRDYPQDIYAIGASILTAATLVDASRLPDPLTVASLERQRQPQRTILKVIEQCLLTDPALRFPSAEALVEACQDNVQHSRAVGEGCRTQDYHRLAIDVGQAIVTSAHRKGDQVWWVSTHPTIGGHAVRDLYAGSAGTALFLCQLYDATGDEEFLAPALGCGRWLWERPPAIGQQVEMPGLYFGECGPGLLYLRLFQSSGDTAWLDRSRAISARVAQMRPHSPDLMTGAAGTGIFQLALWRATKDQLVLDRAADLARWLQATRLASHPGWVIPPDHEQLSGNEYLGLAHGTAGIGLFFAEFGLASGDPVALMFCSDIAKRLIGLGQDCLVDHSGLTWSPTPALDQNRGVYWCHGAAGIARFLVKAHALTRSAEFLEAAERAGRTIFEAAPWVGTTQCHGLAGNIDVLIDIWNASGGVHLDAAHTLGENLAAYRLPQGWPGDSPSLISPDLIVGQAGIGAAFLRLADPARPHLVSV